MALTTTGSPLVDHARRELALINEVPKSSDSGQPIHTSQHKAATA